MINQLYQELMPFQERMHRKSKAIFREYLKNKAEESNLSYQINPKTFASKNVIIGDLRNAEYVFGAHYDTPPRMPAFLIKSVLFFNIVSGLFFLTLIILTIFSVPPLITFTIYMLGLLYSLGLLAIANKYNFNDNTSGVLTLLYLMKKLENKKIAYVFFDNEEKGLIGSMQLAQIMKKSKINMNQKKYIIFDCVGRGKFFGLLSYGNRNVAKKIKDAYLELNIENYSLDLRKPSFFEMSDHVSFKNFNQVVIMCYNRVDKKFILNDIHSHKDNYIDLNNIEVLSKIIEKYLNQGGNYE